MKRIIDYDEKRRGVYALRLAKACLYKDQTGIGTKNQSFGWMLVGRLLTDGDITGVCSWCEINCYGNPPTPVVMPCEVEGCPYEDGVRDQQARLEKFYDDLASHKRIAKRAEKLRRAIEGTAT